MVSGVVMIVSCYLIMSYLRVVSNIVILLIGLTGAGDSTVCANCNGGSGCSEQMNSEWMKGYYHPLGFYWLSTHISDAAIDRSRGYAYTYVSLFYL
jgi:hypothetical protein